MFYMKSENTSTERKPAYQAVADYGIDMRQLEYLSTLTPLERVLQHQAEYVLVSGMADLKKFNIATRTVAATPLFRNTKGR
jgi:hypothetical protein